MSAVTKFVILCLNLQTITSGPLTNGSSVGVPRTAWSDSNTIRLNPIETNGSDHVSAGAHDASGASRIRTQTSSSYNASQKTLSLKTPKDASIDSVTFDTHVPLPIIQTVMQLDKNESDKTINLRNSIYFPGRGEADFDLVLVPPTKDDRVRITILNLNLRWDLAVPSSSNFGVWRERNYATGNKRCKDYLQFKDDSNSISYSNAEKICGELSSYTNGAEKLIGPLNHTGEPGQSVIVSLHRAADDDRDRILGTTWISPYFDSNPTSKLGGELLVSTSPLQAVEDSSSTSPRDFRTTVPITYPQIPRLDFKEFQWPPISRTESPFSAGNEKDTYPYSDSSPFHLMWWVILIIGVIFLNFFALFCKRMREMDTQPRRSPVNAHHAQRNTLRDSFTMPSQLLQRFTERGRMPARTLGARTRTIHAILGIVPSETTMPVPPPRSSSPPPIYPGPASDPYLPSYESLFDTKDNKNQAVTAAVSMPLPSSTSTITCTSVDNNASASAESPRAESTEQQQQAAADSASNDNDRMRHYWR